MLKWDSHNSFTFKSFIPIIHNESIFLIKSFLECKDEKFLIQLFSDSFLWKFSSRQKHIFKEVKSLVLLG